MLRERLKWPPRRSPDGVTAAAAKPAPARRTGRINLLTQILLAIVLVGLLPFVLLSISALTGYSNAGRAATDSAVRMLDQKAIDALQVTAEQTANSIGQFLEALVDDTTAATLLPRTPEAWLAFYRQHERDISYPSGAQTSPHEQHTSLPLYREMAYIDATGQERLKIVDGQVVPAEQLRNVADPANTSYKSEDYFTQTGALKPGEVYISPLTARHSSQQEAVIASGGSANPGAAFAAYKGVMRFGTPVFDAGGALDGIVLLTLDYRHLLEYVIHLQPLSDDAYTLYADYNSGNYAYVFDADGYMIAHPVLGRMRGLDANGRLVPSITKSMPPAALDNHPDNLRTMSWSDPNLPTIFDAVMHKQDGFAITTNLIGTQIASAYAPILLPQGAKGKASILGGVVVGANVNDFHRSAIQISTNIRDEQTKQVTTTLWIAAAGMVLLIAAAILISRSVTRPMHHLTQAASAMEQGKLDSDALDKVQRRRLEDEVTRLAAVFRRMAEQVQLRELNLKQQLQNLRIQVDEKKKQEHVAEITETAYFRDLQQRADALRRKRSDPPPEQE